MSVDKDLVIYRVRGLPPRKNLRGFISNVPISGPINGFLLTRDMDGTITVRDAKCIRRQLMTKFSPSEIYKFNLTEPTVNGDCGGMLIAETHYGPIIVGLHVAKCAPAFGEVYYVAVPITLSDLHKTVTPHELQSGEVVISEPNFEREIRTLHFKSPLRYVERACAEVYGSIGGWRPDPTSSVCKTFICDSMQQFGIKPIKMPPIMRGWRPRYVNLEMMVDTTSDFDIPVLTDCVNSFIEDLSVCEMDSESMHVLDLPSAINGFPGLAYVDSIPRSTSAGYPYNCSKLAFTIEAQTSLHPDGIIFDKNILAKVDSIINTYLSGFRAHPIFMAHFKDEPVAPKKVESCKTRVFTGSPLPFSIVMRKYLLMIVRYMQNNRYAFESAVGIDANCYEWQLLYNYLTQFGNNNIIAGDYSKFDKTMSPEILLGAFDVIFNLCERAGYSSEEMRVVHGIATDISFPTVNFFNDLMGLVGTNPSGHPMTVTINGLVNCLYMRYAYHCLNPNKECRSFKKFVALMTYGDDNIAGVSSSTPWFNHTAIAKILDTVGVGYTMEKKDEASKPYINISEATFLKRYWTYDSDTESQLAPIEIESVISALTMCVPSKNISPEFQSISVMNSMLDLLFQHGRTIFSVWLERFNIIVEDNHLETELAMMPFPSYEKLLRRYAERREDLLNNQ